MKYILVYKTWNSESMGMTFTLLVFGFPLEGM